MPMLAASGSIVRPCRALRRDRSITAHPQALAHMKAGRGDKLQDQVRQAVQRNIMPAERLALVRDLVVDSGRVIEPARPQDGVVEVRALRSAPRNRDRD